MPAVLYCNPTCGHAVAVMLRLRARDLPHVVRPLTYPASVEEVCGRYCVQSSPVLVAGDEILVGMVQILRWLDRLIDAPDLD